ncbi:MAG: hypothetical protein MUC87_15565 [Bacteroidia bacterium]|jgi:hypothetical protein|nr:hypothetical protein [Bacteroidia bacterium]
MSALYYSDNLEAANNFFVASSRITASSTQVKNPSALNSWFLLPFVILLITLWFVFYFVFLVPLCLFSYSAFNLMMVYILRRTKKNLHTYSFEKTESRYQTISELKAVTAGQLIEVEKLGWFPFRKLIRWGISSLLNKVIRLEKLYESVLFAEMPVLSAEESAAYSQFLNDNKDIWQDDSDKIYARDTHDLLKNRYVRK